MDGESGITLEVFVKLSQKTMHTHVQQALHHRKVLAFCVVGPVVSMARGQLNHNSARCCSAMTSILPLPLPLSSFLLTGWGSRVMHH